MYSIIENASTGHIIHNILFTSSPLNRIVSILIGRTLHINWVSIDLWGLSMSIVSCTFMKLLLKDLQFLNFETLCRSLWQSFTRFCWSLNWAKFKLQTSRFEKKKKKKGNTWIDWVQFNMWLVFGYLIFLRPTGKLMS